MMTFKKVATVVVLICLFCGMMYHVLMAQTVPTVAIPDFVAMNAAGAPLVIATGGKGGAYYGADMDMFIKKLGGTWNSSVGLAAGTPFPVQVLSTLGSVANIKMIEDGRANAALAQSDVLMFVDPKTPIYWVKAFNKEFLWVYATNVDSKTMKEEGVTLIKSFEDLDPAKNYILTTPEGSGAYASWGAFKKVSKDGMFFGREAGFYGKFEHRTSPNVGMSISDLQQRDTKYIGGGVTMFVSAVGTQNFKDVIAIGGVHPVKFGDKKLAEITYNGQRIYSIVDVPIPDDYREFYGCGTSFWSAACKYPTAAVDAVLIVSKAWAMANPDWYNIIQKAANQTAIAFGN
jgi:hypothetical protein